MKVRIEFPVVEGKEPLERDMGWLPTVNSLLTFAPDMSAVWRVVEVIQVVGGAAKDPQAIVRVR